MPRLSLAFVSAVLFVSLNPAAVASTDVVDNRAQTTARPAPAPVGSGRRGGGWDLNGTSIDGTRGGLRLDGARLQR